MTKKPKPARAPTTDGPRPPATVGAGANRRPFTSLRAWLAQLASTGRLAVAKPNAKLEHEVAAIAKVLDGSKATLFPSPGGHALPVVSGLVSSRQWIAEAMGVDHADMLSRFEHAAAHPRPCEIVTKAPVHDVVELSPDLLRDLPIPTHNEHDSGPNQATMYVSRCGIYFVAMGGHSPARSENTRTRQRLVQIPLREAVPTQLDQTPFETTRQGNEVVNRPHAGRQKGGTGGNTHTAKQIFEACRGNP